MKRTNPQFGTTRHDVYLRAATHIEAHDVVVLPDGWKPGGLYLGNYDTRPAQDTDANRQLGVACRSARQGQGVWVRYGGPAIAHRGMEK